MNAYFPTVMSKEQWSALAEQHKKDIENYKEMFKKGKYPCINCGAELVDGYDKIQKQISPYVKVCPNKCGFKHTLLIA